MYKLTDCALFTDIIIDGSFSSFGNPGSKQSGSIVFVNSLEWYEKALLNTSVSVIIATKRVVPSSALECSKGLVVSEAPRDLYWEVFSYFQSKGWLHPKMDFGIDESVNIHPTAVIADKVKIGRGVQIGAHAVIRAYSELGDCCTIHEGCIIGCEGMQLYKNSDGKTSMVRHSGGVRLGHGVTMLARSMVSKSVYPVLTEVGDDSCLSLMASVGHQSVLGESCRIAGNCLIGGSVHMGDDVILGPSVTIKDSISIGTGARIRMGSVVIKDVEPNQDVSGNFALSHMKNLKDYLRKTRA